MKTIFIALLCAFVLFGCKSDKQKMEFIICDDDIQYWDMVIHKNKKINDLGYSFSKKGIVNHYEIIDNKYRVIHEDCKNSEEKGCECWSLSKDSLFKTFIVGGIELIQMKIVKCTKDTILGKRLNGDGVILFVRVKDKNSIVKQGDPRRKELLKGGLVPLDL